MLKRKQNQLKKLERSYLEEKRVIDDMENSLRERQGTISYKSLRGMFPDQMGQYETLQPMMQIVPKDSQFARQMDQIIYQSNFDKTKGIGKFEMIPKTTSQFSTLIDRVASNIKINAANIGLF